MKRSGPDDLSQGQEMGRRMVLMTSVRDRRFEEEWPCLPKSRTGDVTRTSVKDRRYKEEWS